MIKKSLFSIFLLSFFYCSESSTEDSVNLNDSINEQVQNNSDNINDQSDSNQNSNNNLPHKKTRLNWA